MLISYEDALFYKILLQAGINEDVDKWINDIEINNDKLEGINLELVSSQHDINKTISCLHNYLNKNEVDDKIICDRLRLYVKQKIDTNKITLNEGIEVLSKFYYANNSFGGEWEKFNILVSYYDLVQDKLINEIVYYKEISQFLETGNLDSNKFWSKPKENKQKKNLLFFIKKLFKK